MSCPSPLEARCSQRLGPYGQYQVIVEAHMKVDGSLALVTEYIGTGCSTEEQALEAAASVEFALSSLPIGSSRDDIVVVAKRVIDGNSSSRCITGVVSKKNGRSGRPRTGTLEQKASGEWVARVTDNSHKRKRIPLKTTDRKIAEARAQELVNGTYETQACESLSEAVNDLVSQRCAGTSRAGRLQKLLSFGPLGDAPLDTITDFDLDVLLYLYFWRPDPLAHLADEWEKEAFVDDLVWCFSRLKKLHGLTHNAAECVEPPTSVEPTQHYKQAERNLVIKRGLGATHGPSTKATLRIGNLEDEVRKLRSALGLDCE